MNPTDPAMIWIGGAPGAGKSTLARLIAIDHDLPLHPIDRWTYVHAARQPVRPLAEMLAEGPESAAEGFISVAYERWPLVLGDVAGRGLGNVPALIEGPQLLPEMADAMPASHAVWLMPDPDQTRRARLARLERVEEPTSRRLLEGVLQRDQVIAERIRTQALDADRPVIDIGPEPDWEAIRTAVEESLAPALAGAERLSAGDPLARQRRFENAAAAEQITLWSEAEGITPDPVFDFACECGRSGCGITWSGTVADYRRGAAAGPVRAESHMID